MQPLDSSLNAAIIHIAGKLFPLGFDVSDTAPSSFKELCGHLNAGNRMVVFAGGSDRTIYADPEVNWAFRAWHDWCHWRGVHDLTLESERAVCRMQTWHIRKLYGEVIARKWGSIIRAEIIGQAQYFHCHKRFPEDQRGFIEAYLRDRDEALLWPLW
ncbi:MAG TPA: hypothetical protein VM755_09805 [Stellaceae bacterium]|nr:hypothetical protein [Stellaceae bacterium]